ncbi:DMT family transporter [Streptomyces mirabilis]|jgi:drug/metabolite transporter (DMT)-like permease|uniref:EamA-like transporter family protein n=1 Tax=Streptomyces mirabilis TaxID=68239 RepID=A0A1I2S938_9ACTN|nr:DMT family transporter [Streptomyces mirabilis]SFG48843.1 EamA-like transporter family protein [Streptomyces mirabilis]
MSARVASPRFLALAGTVVLWASAFPAIRVGIDGLGVAALSFLRLLIAAVALLAVAPFAKVRLPRRGDLPLIILCGATGMTAYQVLLNWGEVHVEAGTASLLIAIAPVFSVLLGSLFLGERLTRNIVVGSVVALAGAAVVSLAEGTSGFSVSALVILGAAAVQGVYHFASKPLLRRYTGLEVATYAMVAGTVFALPLIPATWRATVHAPATALASAAYLGLLPSALGFVIWAYAVARLPLAVSTAALYLVPPVALIVSFVWLAEVPRPVALAGGAISVAGVILISRHQQNRHPTNVPAVDASEPQGATCA